MGELVGVWVASRSGGELVEVGMSYQVNRKGD